MATKTARRTRSNVASADDLCADVFDRNCPSRSVMEHVVSKWGTLALLALADGSFRFNALRRRVDGVSEKMLSKSLQRLENDGLVTRDVLSAIPPRVEYSLTDLGRRIAEQLRTLIDVVEGATPEVVQARAASAGGSSRA
ncbi:winged helix-turn-helix transcriptional regulator [uncultured Jatrophihabitans sp.]|uniref:winged helix-turn-helix transcriptional regulator n=1 Tax=uncultured Jatrophihabitans sp. TaxID=1610747 RepID=UPI0035CAF23D